MAPLQLQEGLCIIIWTINAWKWGEAMPEDKDERPGGDKPGELISATAMLSQIGISIAACLIVGVLVGRFLDSLLGSSPLLLIICSLLGAVAAFKSIFDLAKRK